MSRTLHPAPAVVIGTHAGRWLARVLTWDFEVNADDAIVTMNCFPSVLKRFAEPSNAINPAPHSQSYRRCVHPRSIVPDVDAQDTGSPTTVTTVPTSGSSSEDIERRFGAAAYVTIRPTCAAIGADYGLVDNLSSGAQRPGVRPDCHTPSVGCEVNRCEVS